MAREIFISCQRSDLAPAGRLVDLLQAEGVEAWCEGRAGPDLSAGSTAALSNARIFVLLVSKVASVSEEISRDLAAAILENKLVIPVRLEDVALEGALRNQLASCTWVDAFEPRDNALVELARSLAARIKSTGGEVLPPRRRQPRWRRLALMGLGVVAGAIILGAGIAIFGPA